MSNLRIGLVPALLDEGPLYERAAFGRLEISCGEHTLSALTEADGNQRSYQLGPYVSGYHFAEWLVWNWWRLRWEPRPSDGLQLPLEWDLAHRMSDIGEGYAWPNITFSCDGFQCDIVAERSHLVDSSLFAYLGAPPVAVPAIELENAIDEFVGFVLQRLVDADIYGTNLQTLWNDLTVARNDYELTRFRGTEARLGFDPDSADAMRIENWLADAESLGDNAMYELATGPASSLLSAQQIGDISEKLGFTMNAGDGFRLATSQMPLQWGSTEAWRIGIAMADAVRHEAGLTGQVTNAHLADLAGMAVKVITSEFSTGSLSWVLHSPDNGDRVAIRPHLETGRRFDVSRLIGDRLFANYESALAEPLSPATRSHSYRQKAQRAFAAQLLCPWKDAHDMLKGDFSDENQDQISEYFNVSTVTVKRQIDNSERYRLASYE